MIIMMPSTTGEIKNTKGSAIANSLFYTWNLDLFRLILAKILTKIALFFSSPCLLYIHTTSLPQCAYAV